MRILATSFIYRILTCLLLLQEQNIMILQAFKLCDRKIFAIAFSPKGHVTYYSNGKKRRSLTFGDLKFNRYRHHLNRFTLRYPNVYKIHHDKVGGDMSSEQMNPAQTYVGPVFTAEDKNNFRAKVVNIESIGVELFAGPSQIVPNQLGLFIAKSEYSHHKNHDNLNHSTSNDSNFPLRNDPVHLPKGTVLCGYATGYFTNDCISDKSVGYLFDGSSSDPNNNPFDLVLYNDEVMTLDHAIRQFILTTKNKVSGLSIDWVERKDILWGHIVTLKDNMSNDDDRKKSRISSSKNNNDCMHTIHVYPDDTFSKWVFEPFLNANGMDSVSKGVDTYSISQLGKFANDLAFDPNHDGVESYKMSSDRKNILKIVWRLEAQQIMHPESTDQQESIMMLVPTWPVVIIKSDILIMNHLAMEIGLEYGYHYWNYYLESEAMKTKEASTSVV